MDLELAGKIALVTGAGQGIGRQIALTLAAEGAHVAVNDLFADRALAVAGEIEAAGGKAIGVAADVTDAAAVEAMVARIDSELGGIHILVNNAGIPAVEGGTAFDMRTFAQSEPSTWPRTMDVITRGVMVVTHAVLPHLIEQGYGKIVNVVSDAGVVGEPRQVAYSMAKAGVVGFSRSLAKEVGQHRVNVNCVSPGSTPWRDPEGELQGGEAALQARLRLYPMGRGYGRLGRPSDVADPVVFLCSDRAVWITGAVVRASGGYSIS